MRTESHKREDHREEKVTQKKRSEEIIEIIKRQTPHQLRNFECHFGDHLQQQQKHLKKII
jgi:hypothetical protein